MVRRPDAERIRSGRRFGFALAAWPPDQVLRITFPLSAVPDTYSVEYQHDLWLPKGHLRRLTKGPCFDPKKGAE